MEITNNQNAESFVVRELTEKSNGNAKYFLLSNGNIRAEFYASEYAETISAQETNTYNPPAAVKATAAAADSQTLNLGAYMVYVLFPLNGVVKSAVNPYTVTPRLSV